jgi:hypothetical protein
MASTTIEVSDLREFVADPAKGVDVVGAIDSAEWGYRPFARGSAAVTDGDGGRLITLEATFHVDGEDVQVEMSTTLPARSASGWRWRAGRSWSVTVVGPDGRASGTARLTRRDALRIVYLFEPSGAHTLSDRVRALKMMAGFARGR